MTRPYSNDLRERVVRAHLDGEPIRSVAARFGVSVSSVPKWVARYRATGSVAPGRIGGHRPWLLEPHRESVHALAATTPHLTLDRLQEQLAHEGIAACRDTIWRFLPPYSPDLHPIEQAFAKIKHWMRDAQMHTVEDTWRHLGALLATIEPRECQNYIRNAGYGST